MKIEMSQDKMKIHAYNCIPNNVCNIYIYLVQKFEL